jgi:hypothetical protein
MARTVSCSKPAELLQDESAKIETDRHLASLLQVRQLTP